MECIRCGHNPTRVSNSRSTKQSRQVWRRRNCPSCNRTFTTYEFVNPRFIRVIKDDGPHKYERAKLFSSVYRAIGENATDSYYLTETIEEKLVSEDKEHIEISRVIEVASDTLKNYSKAAYLRYISFYPDFIDKADDILES